MSRFGIAVIAILFCCAPAGATSLLANGGFEAGFSAPWGVGQYGVAGKPWQASNGCGATATIDRRTIHGGSASLHINNPTSRAPHVYASTVQRVRIVPNQRYKISLWARGRNLASRGAVTVIVDPAWTVRPLALPAGTFNWTRFEGTFQLDADYAEFRILTEDRGEAWLDDLVLEPDTTPGQTSVFTDTPPPFHPGLRWHGSFRDGWDFRARVRGLKADGTIVFNLTRWRQDGTARDTGTMEVTVFGSRLTAIRRDAAGRVRQYADGIFGPGGKYVSGQAWNTDTRPSGTRVIWWATIEAAAPAVEPPRRANLNTASVESLEALGLSPRAARVLVEGRLGWGNYRNLDEALAAPGLTAREKTLLRERTDAR